MKSVLSLLFVVLFVSATGAAGSQTNGLTIKSKSCALSLPAFPDQADAKKLPLVTGKILTGTREGFGFFLGEQQANAAVIELLGSDGKVVKTLSVQDFMNLSKAKDAKRAPANLSVNARRVEHVFPLQSSQGEVSVVVKGLETGDANESASRQQLVLTFALRSAKAASFALRVSLPVTGNLESGGEGIVVSAKSGGAAMVGHLYPKDCKVAAQANKLVLTSPALSITPFEESAALWLVFGVVSGSSATETRSLAAKALQEEKLGADDPQIVVVTAADKEYSGSKDTASYVVMCANIGTGDASNVVLNNPIPKGTRYIDGSATSDGMTLSVDKASVTSPGEVQALRWTVPHALKPGAERLVVFKVIVQ